MANERFSSQLISEGTSGPSSFRSLSRTIIIGVVLTVVGVVLVWSLFLLLASA